QCSTGAEGPKPPMPCSTIVPLQTASSGVPPGAAMSTPSSRDHVAGGETSPLGMGNSNPFETGPCGAPPPDEPWPPEPEPPPPELPLDGEPPPAPDPEEPPGDPEDPADDCAASSLASWWVSEATWSLAPASC